MCKSGVGNEVGAEIDFGIKIESKWRSKGRPNGAKWSAKSLSKSMKNQADFEWDLREQLVDAGEALRGLRDEQREVPQPPP